MSEQPPSLKQCRDEYVGACLNPEVKKDFQDSIKYQKIGTLLAQFDPHKPDPEADFLRTYIELQKPDGTVPVATSLLNLNRAHETGMNEATALLAMVHLGFYPHIPETDRNYFKGVELMQMAADRDYPFAMYQMAYLYVYQERTDDAAQMAERLVKMNHIGGYYLQAKWMQNPPTVAWIQSFLGAVNKFTKGYDVADAKDIFSWEIKYAALYEAGVMHYEGFPQVPQNKEKGLPMIRLAARKGIEEAETWLQNHNYKADSDDPPHEQEQMNPMAWLGGKITVHNYGQSPETGYAESTPSEFNNPLLAGCDRSRNGEYFTIEHPEEENAEHKYKPSIRVRIHFPDEQAMAVRERTDGNDFNEEILEEILAELDTLPGLRDMKETIRNIVSYGLIIKKRQNAGLNIKSLGQHMVFSGNPGTGKTHIARMIGKLLYQAGLLEDGHVVEADYSVLTGEYIGWPTSKTRLACELSLGGVLFIDEAYMLSQTDGTAYAGGQESIDTFLKFMEDYNGKFVLIAAGYKDKMKSFVMANPGLRSRFSRTIEFRDYTNEEKLEIFDVFCKESDYILSAGARTKLLRYFKNQPTLERDRAANARGVRNLFDTAISKQAERLMREKAESREELMLITEDDLPEPHVSPFDGSKKSSGDTVTPFKKPDEADKSKE